MSNEQKKIASIQMVPFTLDPNNQKAVLIQREGSNADTIGWAIYLRDEDGIARIIADRNTEADAVAMAKALCKRYDVPLEPYPWQDTVRVSFIPNLKDKIDPPKETGLLSRFFRRHQDEKKVTNSSISGHHCGTGCNCLNTYRPDHVPDPMLADEDQFAPPSTAALAIQALDEVTNSGCETNIGLIPSMEFGKVLMDQAQEQCETRESRFTDVDVKSTYPCAEDNDAKYGGDATPATTDTSSPNSSDPDDQ